jgi:uncharacterized small protein (DUF1192 family)
MEYHNMHYALSVFNAECSARQPRASGHPTDRQGSNAVLEEAEVNERVAILREDAARDEDTAGL